MSLSNLDKFYLSQSGTLTREEILVWIAGIDAMRERAKELRVSLPYDSRANTLEAAIVRFLLNSREEPCQ